MDIRRLMVAAKLVRVSRPKTPMKPKAKAIGILRNMSTKRKTKPRNKKVKKMISQKKKGGNQKQKRFRKKMQSVFCNH